VSLTGSRVSRAARRELFRIFADSATRFGEDASLRYEELIIQAIRDLVENPQRIGARPVGARIHYHLRHSRNRVDGGRVRDPRHLLVAKIVRTRLVVLAVVHDAMVAETGDRADRGPQDVVGQPFSTPLVILSRSLCCPRRPPARRVDFRCRSPVRHQLIIRGGRALASLCHRAANRDPPVGTSRAAIQDRH